MFFVFTNIPTTFSITPPIHFLSAMASHSHIHCSRFTALLTVVLLMCLSLCSCHDDDMSGGENEEDGVCHIAVVVNDGDRAQWEMAVQLFQEMNEGNSVQLNIDWYDEEGDIDKLSERLAADKAIDAIVGFSNSEDASIAATRCQQHEKPLLLPVATATELHRNYGDGIGVWFMAEDDDVQCDLLVNLAYKNGAESIALFYPDTEYGRPFASAIKYPANDLNLPIDTMQKYDEQNFEDNLRSLLRETDAYIICVVNDGEKALAAARINSELGIDAHRLIFSDGALDNYVLTDDDNIQLEGICLSAHPESQFAELFAERFGTPPASGVAQLYDALTLAMLGYIYSCADDCLLNTALFTLLSEGRDEIGISTTAAGGLARASQMLADHVVPKLLGASGRLQSTLLLPAIVQGTYYAHWAKGEGLFSVADVYTESLKDVSMAYANYIDLKTSETGNPDDGTFDYPDLDDQWVLLVAASAAWHDLRHQADILRLYQWLHDDQKGGFSDDHIILIADTTVLYNGFSPTPGQLMLGDDGTDLTENAEIDYTTSQLTADDICNILTGNRTERTPVVLPTNPACNVTVFWCGHDIKSGLELGKPYSGNVLTQKKLAAALQEMSGKNMYRKMLWTIEACYAGYTATAFEGIPGAMAILSADHEESFAYQYDHEYGQYVSNRFSSALYYDITHNPFAPLIDVYHDLARFTVGSHVKMVNQEHFDNLRTTSLGEFAFCFNR